MIHSCSLAFWSELVDDFENSSNSPKLFESVPQFHSSTSKQLTFYRFPQRSRDAQVAALRMCPAWWESCHSHCSSAETLWKECFGSCLWLVNPVEKRLLSNHCPIFAHKSPSTLLLYDYDDHILWFWWSLLLLLLLLLLVAAVAVAVVFLFIGDVLVHQLNQLALFPLQGRAWNHWTSAETFSASKAGAWEIQRNFLKKSDGSSGILELHRNLWVFFSGFFQKCSKNIDVMTGRTSDMPEVVRLWPIPWKAMEIWRS